MAIEQVVNVQDLQKIYPNGKVAVGGISFALNRGEVFGLLGPNGSGKTTTILMLLGLLEPTDGKVSVLGHDPFRTPLEVKRHVGYLPDTVGFYENMSVYDNIDYTTQFLGFPRKERIKRIDGALERMHLTARRNDKVRTLSHGLKQRLGFAEILVKQPEIAILDEPTQGLDPESVSEFLDTISSLRDEFGMTVLLSSHQLNEVQSVCNRAGLFSEGKLIQSGTIEELAESQFGNSKIVELRLEKPMDITSVVKGMTGVTKLDSQDRKAWYLECSTDVRSALVRVLVDKGINIESVTLQLHSLDDIYKSCFKEVANE
ncbi:MAG: ABC transporter ATP-binding protein [Spirochaetia bacterium]|jgi:ABC-2 type transport system ATP-binding protein|nr:ABC transporter ATP-binding protein [Spirochaetia bacterium]